MTIEMADSTASGPASAGYVAGRRPRRSKRNGQVSQRGAVRQCDLPRATSRA